MRLPFLIVLALTIAPACGGGSSAGTSTPTAPTATTPPPAATPAPSPAPTTSQATSIATGIGGLTATALASGASQFGIASVGTGRVVRMAASGSTFSSANCSSSGRMDLIYARDYTPTSAGVDLTALKAVFTSCVMAADAPAASGELAMAGTYTGSRQTGTITLTGSLTTAAGACAITGAVTAGGSFSGTACGSAVAATTPPPVATPAPPTTPTPGPTPTQSLSGTWIGQFTTFDPLGSVTCGRDENALRMELTQSGSSVSGAFTWTITQSFFPPDVGKSFTQPVVGTVTGSSVALTVGTAARNFSGTGTFTTTAMSGTFIQGSCQPMPFSVTRQ